MIHGGYRRHRPETAALEVCLQLRELIAILFVTVVRLTALMISWIARLLQVTTCPVERNISGCVEMLTNQFGRAIKA